MESSMKSIMKIKILIKEGLGTLTFTEKDEDKNYRVVTIDVEIDKDQFCLDLKVKDFRYKSDATLTIPLRNEWGHYVLPKSIRTKKIENYLHFRKLNKKDILEIIINHYGMYNILEKKDLFYPPENSHLKKSDKKILEYFRWKDSRSLSVNERHYPTGYLRFCEAIHYLKFCKIKRRNKEFDVIVESTDFKHYDYLSSKEYNEEGKKQLKEIEKENLIQEKQRKKEIKYLMSEEAEREDLRAMRRGRTINNLRTMNFAAREFRRFF